jgi:hypothetical protein
MCVSFQSCQEGERVAQVRRGDAENFTKRRSQHKDLCKKMAIRGLRLDRRKGMVDLFKQRVNSNCSYNN